MARRRVSAWIAIPTVVLCGGLGVLLGLMVPPQSLMWRAGQSGDRVAVPSNKAESATAIPPSMHPAALSESAAVHAPAPSETARIEDAPAPVEKAVDTQAEAPPALPPHDASDSAGRLQSPAVHAPAPSETTRIEDASAPVEKAVDTRAETPPALSPHDASDSAGRLQRSAKVPARKHSEKTKDARPERLRATRERQATISRQPPERSEQSRPILSQIPILGPVVGLFIP